MTPHNVTINQINPGDTVTVVGIVVGPFDGTNGYGAAIEEPYVLTYFIDDPAVPVGGQS